MRTKSWKTQDGVERAGKLIDKSNLYKMLNNPIYYGVVRFKGQEYNGVNRPGFRGGRLV